MATPELKIPEGWEDRAPGGWDWLPLWEAVERGHHEFTHDFVTNAIETDIGPKIILDDGLFPGFNLQGDRFSEQIIFIPEMLITARAMKAGLALIRPLLAAMAEKPLGHFVIGTVLGDMHDIGQSIVTIMLENAGFVELAFVEVGESRHDALRGLEHHGDVVSQAANRFETIVVEAVRP